MIKHFFTGVGNESRIVGIFCLVMAGITYGFLRTDDNVDWGHAPPPWQLWFAIGILVLIVGIVIMRYDSRTSERKSIVS